MGESLTAGQPPHPLSLDDIDVGNPEALVKKKDEVEMIQAHQGCNIPIRPDVGPNQDIRLNELFVGLLNQTNYKESDLNPQKDLRYRTKIVRHM